MTKAQQEMMEEFDKRFVSYANSEKEIVKIPFGDYVRPDEIKAFLLTWSDKVREEAREEVREMVKGMEKKRPDYKTVRIAQLHGGAYNLCIHDILNKLNAE